MDELHRRLIRIGLDALADDFGYALAGGYAVQAHQIVNRVSDDVDLFAPINRATVEMPAATERVIAAYEAAGFTVELAHQNPEHTYTRLNVTDPASGIQNKVELVAEFLNHPPVPSDLRRSGTGRHPGEAVREFSLPPPSGPHGYPGTMTTREELHALIDRVPDDDLDAVVQTLRPFIGPAPRPARPSFIGMGRSGHSDTSARADEILRETGFGE